MGRKKTLLIILLLIGIASTLFGIALIYEEKEKNTKPLIEENKTGIIIQNNLHDRLSVKVNLTEQEEDDTMISCFISNISKERVVATKVDITVYNRQNRLLQILTFPIDKDYDIASKDEYHFDIASPKEEISKIKIMYTVENE